VKVVGSVVVTVATKVSAVGWRNSEQKAEASNDVLSGLLDCGGLIS
jgi:hypothetical protein